VRAPGGPRGPATNLAGGSRSHRSGRPVNRPAVDSQPGFVRVGRQAGRFYNEAAFRYVLGLEWKRADRARRQLLLVFVRAGKHLGTRPRLALRTSEAVFHALGDCVREVDLVGWYLDGVVAAAVLHISDIAAVNARQTLAVRLDRVLRRRLSEDEVERLDVRFIELGRKPRT
jgi:hypothetical protein